MEQEKCYALRTCRARYPLAPCTLPLNTKLVSCPCHAARGGHRHRQDQGTLTKERIEKEGVVPTPSCYCEFVNL